jgi:PKD repeat protein
MPAFSRIRPSVLLVLPVAVAVAVATGCSVEESARPTLTGPSEFALSVTLTAAPDQLPPDGASQSIITVTVRDASGRPVEGQRLSVSTNVGTLSASQVVTGSDGRASFAFTAPASGASGNAAVISVVPVGDNAGGAVSRTVTILLTTGGPNRTAPVPDFSVTPTSPEANIAVRFDASTTKDEGAACLDACTYSWIFGDGTTGSGRIVEHTFTAARTYTVTLTVTDAAGSSASIAKTVTVGRIAAPTVTLSVTPDPPLAGQLATLNATATPATGHSITRFSWNFGDGTSQTTTTPTVTKRFDRQGKFVVTVTATDDIGQTGSASRELTITSSAIHATIVFSPTDPAAGQRVHFRALNPTAPDGATIEKFEWNFGDSEESDGGTATGQSVEHKYNVGKSTYVVRLTITDSKGNVGVFTKDIPIE